MASANFDVISYNSNSYYPRDTINYLIKGTQTAQTNNWTGPLPEGITDYEEGLTIDYFLPYSGNTTAATLNLGGKGAKPIYFNDAASHSGHVAERVVQTIRFAARTHRSASERFQT